MKTRVRKGRKDEERLTGNLVGAEFVHFTTRPVQGKPDPALHAHCVVFNATHDAKENLWKAGYFRDLKRDAPYWQAAFHARLAANLRQIGYDTERRGKSWDVAAVSRATAQRFSRRTAQIEQLAQTLGVTDPDAKAKLGATSRAAKGEHTPWPDLVQEWDGRLAGPERQRIQAARAGATQPVASLAGAETHAVNHAIAHLFTRKAVVSHRDLMAEALRFGVGHVAVEDVDNALKKERLIRLKDAGQVLVTTPAIVREEKAILRFARQGQGTRARLGKRGRTSGRPWLAADQRAAVDHVLTTTDQVILVRGVAGTGKTTLTKEAVEAIEENGRRVVLLAPSAEASRGVLRQEGFASADTVAMFLTKPELRESARGGVLWVDEAGLLSVPDTARLFEAAKELDARVVLMGDALQHQSPNRGGAFKLLQEQSGLPCAEVKDIRRQQGAYKEAVKHLSEGRVSQGLAGLDALGWIHEMPNAERDWVLATAYAETRDQGKTALIVSPTHAEGDKVTAAVRAERKARGQLGDEREVLTYKPLHLTPAEAADPHAYEPGDMIQFFRHAKGAKAGERFTVVADGRTFLDRIGAARPFDLATQGAGRFGAYRPAKLRLAAGDVVRATAGGKTKDGRHRIENGALFTIAGFTPRGDLVVDGGRVIDQSWGHLTHGYVLTSDASQGKTVDRVFIGQSALSIPATRREQVYVSASRAREQVQIFTDDKERLRQAAKRGDERLTATELLRRRKRAFSDRLREHLGNLRRWAAAHRPQATQETPTREVVTLRA